MTGTVLALDWTDPAALGYPVIFGGVLLGSIVPIVPTGAVVGAAAAVATTTDHLSLPIVILLATAAALVGDLITFGAGRAGSEATLRWVSRGQAPERLTKARQQFARRGWQLVVIGRLVPAGRIPVLLAAATLAFPWRKLVPSAAAACLLWAGAYSVLGIVSGGLFDSPLIATLLATVLVLVVGALGTLVQTWRGRRARARAAAAPPAPADPGPLDGTGPLADTARPVEDARPVDTEEKQ
jgi:membrane protein DedA with SNARE-associated domain